MSQISEYQSNLEIQFFWECQNFFVPKTTFHKWRSPFEPCTKSFGIHKMKLDFQNIDWESITFEHYCKEICKKN